MISYSDIWQSSKRIEYQNWKESWYEKATEWENRRENVRKGKKVKKKKADEQISKKVQISEKNWITGHKDLNSLMKIKGTEEIFEKNTLNVKVN